MLEVIKYLPSLVSINSKQSAVDADEG